MTNFRWRYLSIFVMFLVNLIYILSISSCFFTDGQHPPGHLQPLGSHMPPMPVDVQEDITPLEFFQKYVKASKPVLLRGVAKSFPSFDSFRNDQYLKQQYGEWEIQAEPVKKETRKAAPLDMSYAQFLDTYNDSNIYLIADIVPSHPIARDVFIPKCMSCGGYTDVIINSVMWFSSGGTKSVLHNDDLENVNCLYDGVKELVLFDKKHNDLVPIDRPEGHYSSVDVDSVDMYKYPTLSKVPWYKATMEPGDCFYIPYKSFLVDILDSSTSTIKLSSFRSFFEDDSPGVYNLEKLEQFFRVIDKDSDNELTQSEILAATQQDLQLFYDYLSSVETDLSFKSEPAGHLQPLGSHMDPLSIEVRETWPDPVQFHNDYVLPGKPVVFRGAAKKFPGYSNWQSDAYLKSKYGSWEIEAEEGKKENRSKYTYPMSFEKFINKYEKSDIYLVSDIHPTNPMAEELFLPKSLLCGGFTDVLNTAVMWFSSGGTKSVLHNDGFDNLNCIYDGTKDLVFIDKKHEDILPIDNKKGSYSSVDVESVDMHKYPTLSQIPWYNATITAGDCIFIPFKWFHQVNSMGSRNLAINIWWRHLPTLPNRSTCQGDLSTLPEHAALSNYKFLDESERHRSSLFEMFEGMDTISYDAMTDALKTEGFSSVDEKYIEDFFNGLDADANGILSVDEVNAASAETLMDFYEKLFEESEEPDFEETFGLKEEL